MIFDELVLHNFGVYGGRQTLELTPSPGKPILLIGGLNGGGKTTLLDAVQLVLFGKLAPCSNRGALPYETYLREAIHRGVSESEGAAVELAFRHRLEGVEQQIRVRRSWRSTGKGLRERLEVEREGELDPALSEQWLESVDQFIPIGIARLVFFDGEKIESLADPETSSEALAAGVHGLLGLDVVDRLATDLSVYERRERSKLAREVDRGAIEASEKALQQLSEERERLVAERGHRRNELDRARRTLRACERRFQREGGDLFEQRTLLEAEGSAMLQQVTQAEEALRDLASGVAPLLQVSELISSTEKRAVAEERAVESQRTDNILRTRDDEILEALRHELEASAIERVEALLAEDRRKRKAVASTDSLLGLSPVTCNKLSRLSNGALAETRRLLASSLKRWRRARRKLDRIDRTVASIPAEDAIAELLSSRTKAQEGVQQAERVLRTTAEDLDRVRRAQEQEQARYERLLAREAEAEFEQEDAHRAIQHSTRVRRTLDRFRHALVERSSRKIASLVLEGLRHLLRKEHLVKDLEIDPSTFGLCLHGPDGNNLPPERLSAGERQLLAVALLWGLGRASGQPLPIIIDTPLGRLDSSHRTHLSERYFPSASHQVLLLSTDEEITPVYWKRLRRHVARSYTLVHDDQMGSTRIEEGYFW